MKKDQRKVLIISASNPTRAYSCIKYLYQALRERYDDVYLWAAVPNEQKEEYLSWGKNVNSFFFNIFGKIPKIRMIFMLLLGWALCFRFRNQVIVCHDLFFYRACVWVKKIFPKTTVVQYCTELYTERSPKFHQKLLKNFTKNPNAMDFTIECDGMRAEYRKETFGISKIQKTILNTMPLNYSSDLEIFAKGKSDKLPVVIFSGGIYEDGDIDIIVDAVSQLSSIDFVFKIYCYGVNSAIDYLKNKCQSCLPAGKWEVIVNTPRDVLLQKLRDADVGISYYDPLYSINTKYAAPTKFFEYVYLGLPIVSSANDSLVALMDKYKLGLYMKENTSEALADCIKTLVCDAKLRQDISEKEKEAFEKYLCYEKQSEEVVALFDSYVIK